MIETAVQLKALIRNRSNGNSNKANILITQVRYVLLIMIIYSIF